MRGFWQAAGGETRLFTWEDAAEPQTCLQLPSGWESRREERSSRRRSNLYASTSLLFIIWLARHAVVSHQLIPRTGDQGRFKPLVITFGLVSALISLFHMDVWAKTAPPFWGGKGALMGQNVTGADGC